MSIAVLLLSLALVVALLVLWAFRIAPRIGQDRLDRAQRGAMIALHTITALAIVSAGILYLDEQQWSPRLDVELKADPQRVPLSNPESAVVQLAIAITNKTETDQTVNFIEIHAFGIRGPARQNPGAPQELGGTEIFRSVTAKPNDIDPDETFYQFIEIPVPCAWSLVRVTVHVPKPPAQLPQRGKPRDEYERKMLVPIADVCAKPAA